MTVIICSTFAAWGNLRPLPSFQTQNHEIKLALYEQDRIGWKSFIDGFHTTRFRGIQEVYFKSNLIQKSSLKWKSDLQNRIWRIPWHMWSHRNHVLHQQGTTIHQKNLKRLTVKFNQNITGIVNIFYSNTINF